MDERENDEPEKMPDESASEEGEMKKVAKYENISAGSHRCPSVK